MAVDFILQSTQQKNGNGGGRKLHAAIIMDGNGRWATARGLPRLAGHRAGADAVRRTVERAPEVGIGVLTLYAFSSDNWRRPAAEVSGLMELLDLYLRQETRRCLENGVRLEVIGRRDRLDPKLAAAIGRTEAATAAGQTLALRVAVDYSARDAIRRGEIGPDVDLLIRTGGEQRLSDFLLWESAYAELIFSRRMWPDFGGDDLGAAVREFRSRERRFGGVPEPGAVGNGNGGRRSSWLD
jgi:undecaprenyl diphosphate synthase